MNKIEFNVTGPDRKNLVTAIGEILGLRLLLVMDTN